jgi:hypothetical protein
MRRTVRRRVVTAALLPLALLLGGCGEQGDDYCAAVREHQERLSEIAASDDQGALFEALDVYRQLQEEAPADLGDEWSQVVGRLAALERAVRDAGVDPASYDPKDPPQGLSREDRTAIRGAARDLGDPETAEAMEGLEQQALDVCKTPLAR